MTRLPAILVLGWAICWQALAADMQTETQPQTLIALPKPVAAPDFTLPDIEGGSHTLSDYRGKLVILNFWATWCPPCRFEMPAMERARQATLDDDIVILAVDIGEKEDTVFEFTASYPVEFTLLLDESGEIINSYPVIGLPTTYIIDPAGRITHRAIGSREWDDPKLLAELRRLAKQGK